MNTLIIIGVVAALGYFAYTQCWFNICQGQLELTPEEFNEILPGMFPGGPKLSQSDRQRMADHIQSGKETIDEHNARPTTATGHTDSNYRTTWRVPRDPVKIAQIDARQKAAPAATVRKFADNSVTRMSSFCAEPKNATSPLCKCPAGQVRDNLTSRCRARSNYSKTLFAETVLGGRLSN